MSDGPVRTEVRGDVTVVVVSGEIDLTNADQLARAVEQSASRTVVVDLGAVTYIDSAGLRAVDRAGRATDASNRRLRLVVPPGSPAAWTFRVAGFVGGSVVASLDEALGG